MLNPTTPIKDWQAMAHKWMLVQKEKNIPNQKQSAKLIICTWRISIFSIQLIVQPRNSLVQKIGRGEIL